MSAEESPIGSLSLDRSDSNGNGDQSTVSEDAQFWHEDPWIANANEDPNPGRGAAGGQPQGEAPPPYPGNAQQGNLLQMIQGILVAQQNQVEANARAHQAFQEAHNQLGNDIRAMVHAQHQMGNDIRQFVEMNPNRNQGGRPHPLQTFKPSMFRALDMKALNKDNKLLSEEFINWKLSILRVLRANPGAANLPIDQLTALILASIGEKAERRLTGLGQNPTFNSLDEFFDKLQSIFCSSTVKSEAENQFHTAKQYPNEDLNGWHARCLLYFRLAFPTQDYWNILLKKFFGGMLNKKLAWKTCEHISHRPGGWDALLNQEGYELCLSLTIRDEASEGFKNSFLGDKPSSFKSYEKTETSVPMDTSSVQNRTYPKGQGHRSSRNTTAYVNQRQGPSNPGRQPPSNSNGNNPPAGMQKKLQAQARSQRTPKTDRSQDKCLKCGQIGHWARDCTTGAANESVNAAVTTIVPETQNWSDTSIISSVSNSSKSSHSTEQYDFSRAQQLWPKTDRKSKI